MDAAGYDPGYKKWRYDDLPILPEPFRYVLVKDKADAFQNLKRLMDREDVTELVNACDAGREGELIFRLVYEMAGCTKPFSRLWISSMEDAAIREGFADLRPGAEYDPLYQSRSAAKRQTGSSASMRAACFPSSTTAPWRCWPTRTVRSSWSARRNTIMCAWRWEGAEAVSDRIVSPENAQAIRDACSEFFPDVAARVNDKEVSDHHAILPTLELEKADVPGLPVGERNILLLVCCKLLCAAEPFVYETVTAAFDCGGHTFTAKGKQVLSQGWPSRRYSVPP